MSKLHLGLDVHKDSITIGIANPSSKGEFRPYGTIINDLRALEKALARIRKAHPGIIDRIGAAKAGDVLGVAIIGFGVSAGCFGDEGGVATRQGRFNCWRRRAMREGVETGFAGNVEVGGFNCR